MAVSLVLVCALSSASLALAAATPTLTIVAGNGSYGVPTPGTATGSALDNPYGVAVDPTTGDVYIADSNNHVIERVTPSGTLSIVAGTGIPGAPTPGLAIHSRLGFPQAVAVDPTTGDLYIADLGDREIERVTPSGTLTIVAGNGQSGAPTPGLATNSELNTPYGVAVNPTTGDLYIADASNQVIERVTPSGTLTVVAGHGQSGNPTPGTATGSALWYPEGVAVDPSTGDLYIADSNNNVIERVTPSGTLSIVAGVVGGVSPAPGPAISSPLGYPEAVALDPTTGDLYIADPANSEIEQVSASGSLTIVAGTGSSGAPAPGPASSSPLDNPDAVAVNPTTGDLYIADTDSSVIAQVMPPTPVNITSPSISGTAQVYQLLTATDGVWANNPTAYTYQWQDCDSSGGNCTDIAGATSQSYTVTGADMGDPIRVVVTATNGGGSQASTSAPTAVVPAAPTTTTATATAPLPSTTTATVTAPLTSTTPTTTSSPLPVTVSGPTCPAASGSMTGPRLGPVALGMTRAQARRALPIYEVTHNGFDRFCLDAGAKIRVGYASARLLDTLSARQRTETRDRIVLALTANHHYALDHITPGTPVVNLHRQLARAQRFQIGQNTWYVIRGAHATGILKVQHDTVLEIGIANLALTTSRTQQRQLLNSFTTR